MVCGNAWEPLLFLAFLPEVCWSESIPRMTYLRSYFSVCECSCFCGLPHIRDNILFFWHGFLFPLLLMWAEHLNLPLTKGRSHQSHCCLSLGNSFMLLCPSPLQIGTFVAVLTLSDCTQLSIFLFGVLSHRPNFTSCLFIGLSMNMVIEKGLKKFTIVGTYFLGMNKLCWICSTYHL